VAKDTQGNPIADGVLVWANQDNGQKYTLKTNKKGEYFSLGIAPGSYVVTLYKNADELKANKELFHVNKFQVQLDENNLDFDLKKEQENSAKGQGLTPEQIKAMQEAQEKQKKEVNTVKTLNDKLNAAKTAADAGDYDTAIASLNEATQVDPNRDLIWFKLGDYYRLSAPKQTDSAEKQKRLDSAVQSCQKAVELKKGTTNDKDPNAAKSLAAYYNTLAEAYAKAGKTDDAVKTYAQAAQVDPTGAGQYYFNTGAVLTNTGKVDDAIVAFDKVIAADPNRADAYYWKGVNLIGKATLQGDKMVAPPGTADAFQKYLELQPTGTYADAAKQMLASIGASVETTYGTTKKKPAPKK
jgi:tetratricopeptide (TPR) repeat protein